MRWVIADEQLEEVIKGYIDNKVLRITPIEQTVKKDSAEPDLETELGAIYILKQDEWSVINIFPLSGKISSVDVRLPGHMNYLLNFSLTKIRKTGFTLRYRGNQYNVFFGSEKDNFDRHDMGIKKIEYWNFDNNHAFCGLENRFEKEIKNFLVIHASAKTELSAIVGYDGLTIFPLKGEIAFADVRLPPFNTDIERFGITNISEDSFNILHRGIRFEIWYQKPAPG
jgi:hypothetical protein